MAFRSQMMTEKRVGNVAFRVCHDPSPGNDRTEEPLTRIVSWSRNVQGDAHDYATPGEFMETIRPGDVVHKLYGYKHGGTALSLEPFPDRWDAFWVGYVLVTPERVQALGVPADRLEGQIRAEIEIEQQYMNGEVYQVHAHGLVDGVALEEPCVVIGGIYGFDDAVFDEVASEMLSELPERWADGLTGETIAAASWDSRW